MKRTRPSKNEFTRWLCCHPPVDDPLFRRYNKSVGRRASGHARACFGHWLYANHRVAFTEQWDRLLEHPERWPEVLA